MKSKRSFNKFLIRETVIKPADQLVGDLLKSLSDLNNIKEPGVQNLKIECMINFLNNIRVTMLGSDPNEDKASLENELIKNSKSISYVLISCLLQVNSTVIRLISLRILLYLAHFSKIHQQLHEFKINIYIVRLIDLNLSDDDTALAIEYIRLIAQLYPNCLDESLVYCLLASLEDPKYRLNNIILETLLEIACKQPKLACKCQIFTELINYVVNVCSDNEFCIEIIIQTLIKLLDKQEYRDQIKFEDLFRNLIAPFVDYDYVPLLWGSEFASHSNTNFTTQLIENKTEHNEPKITEILSSCSYALLTLLTSYSGLMCFTTNDYQLLRDLISPLSWFLKSNKRDFLEKELNQISTSSSFQSYQVTTISNKKLTQIQQIIASQLVVLNYLIDFLYKLFKIDEISTKSIRKFSDNNKYASTNANDLLNDDEFINLECDKLLRLIDDHDSQVKSHDAVDENTSSSPNLSICFRAFLLKSFIEVGLFESLLDLYYGLPVSFLENNFNYSKLNMNSNYQNLSLKCLNLFANLYHLANNLFDNEYCIDNFNELRNLDSTKFYNKGIYTEMKKLSLVSYLQKLNDPEREKEVLFYLTELQTKKESFKNGSSPPTEELASLSFYAQQFLSHAGFMSSNKFEIELEILNLTNTHQLIESSFRDESNMFLSFMHSLVDDRREAKKIFAEIEKRLEEQIDSTLVLQIDLNVSNYDVKLNQQQQELKHWNWFEIIKLFELYLLTSSSMQPRFSPTQDALVLNQANKKFFQNEKLLKCLSKLFNFFILKKETLSSITLIKNTQSTSSVRLSSSFQSTSNMNDLMLCTGCYLIDFALSQFNVANLNPNNLNRSDANRYFSPYENLLIQMVQNIKNYLTIEFLPNTHTYKRNTSASSLQNRFITRESLVSYYIFFLGHLSGSEAGDRLIDSFKLYDLISKIIETTKDISAMKLVCSSFNYYVSVKSRSILEKCLSLSYAPDVLETDLFASYCEFKIYTLKLIFNVYRACSSKFEAFFIDIIISSINSNYLLDDKIEKPISQVDFTNQYIIELSLNLIVHFLNQRPDLVSPLVQMNSVISNKIDLLKKLIVENEKLKRRVKNYNLLKTKVKLILNRLLLSKDKIESLTLEAVEQLVDDWDKNRMDFKYYQMIERNAFNLNAINSFYCDEYDDRVGFSAELEADSARNDHSSAERFIKLYRRINDANKNTNLYLSLKAAHSIPVHLFSVLIRVKCFNENKFYLNEKFEKKILNYIDLIQKSAHSSSRILDDKLLKAAMWSTCSLLNCEKGFKYLGDLNFKYKIFSNLFCFSSSIVKIAESYPNLSVRTTGFFCLNLMSKTCTGANLIGKIGWHTFQPNKFTETKAFYSVLSSFSNDDEEDFNYSPIDTAVTLYNLNRIKTKLDLNLMSTISGYEFSNNEKEFLEEQNKIDLINESDDYFMKSEDNLTKIGFFHDNITVPMKQALMSVSSTAGVNQLEVNIHKKLLDDFEQDDQVKKQIINWILMLTPVSNLEKIRTNLFKLKLQCPEKFDITLHNYVSIKILAKHKFKFHFRKYIQELFIDVS